jgi:VWFA-related protein
MTCTRRAAKLALAFVLGAAGWAGELQGQARLAAGQSSSAFKTAVNYVEVDAVAVDQRGGFVSDLRAADFELLEDGRPQIISALDVVDLLMSSVKTPAGRPATATGGLGLPAHRDAAAPTGIFSNDALAPGALYVLVLDDLHTAPARTARVKQLASRFVETCVGAGDAAAVLSTGMEGRIAQEFSSSPGVLGGAIGRFVGRKPASQTLAVLASVGCFNL